MKFFKTITAAALSAGILLTASCSRIGTEGDPSAAAYAVLYTTDSGSQSQIEWLNERFEVTGTSRYAFSGASLDGFANAHQLDGNPVLVPRGENADRDYGKIVIIHPSDGAAEEIEIGRINPTGYDAKDGRVAVASNLNYEGFVDVVDIETGNMKSVKTSDSGMLVTDVMFVNGRVYAAAQREGHEGCCICLVDIERNACDVVMEIPDDTTFLAQHGSDLVFVTEGQLVKYDTATGAFTRLPLTRRDAFNIRIVDDTLLVAYTDIHDEACDSLIEWRDYTTGEVLYRTEHSGAILQLEGKHQEVFVLGYEQLYQYEVSQGELVLKQRIACQKNHYYLGGFYILEQEEKR